MSRAPGDHYRERLAARSAEATRLRARERALSNLRLATFGAGVALGFAAFGAEAISGVWLLPAIVAFAALMMVHEATIGRRTQAERAVAYYEAGLARVSHRFAGTGRDGAAHRPAHHPYADDLDVFGRGSLFEWLCTARTLAGEATLARWLLSPAPLAEVRERQEAVRELRDRADLREAIALLGEDVRVGLHPETLRAWGEAPAVGFRAHHAVVAAVLGGAALAATAAWVLGAGPVFLMLVVVVEGGFALAHRGRVRAVVDSVDTPARELALLSALLERIEAEQFTCPALRRLRATLDTDGVPPSRRIARLRLLLELLDARRNQFFAPIAALLMWGTQCAAAVERWRAATGPHLGGWMDAIGELEALLALAGNAWEHPAHTLPELVDEGPCLEGTDVGHPLLSDDVRVCNDIALDPGRPLLVVSGSNMSGKSTWLRSLGVNVVLAQAGGAVCAGALRLSPLAVGASIRIVDSLQEGASHFYAEITRLRTILDLTEGDRPTLFLLDEILHGTNSRDRAAGAEAVVHALVERGAIGLVTTHDLTLAGIAERLGARADNVHFADHLEDGEMRFDYKVQPGVVRQSNALALMREVGLPVD